MNTLAHGKINHVQVWNPYGLSKKFKVVFDDGKMASGKLMRPFSFWNPAFREVPYRSADRTHRRFSRSAWGDYQALGEIGAFYVDRALGWMRKPPTSGRRISSHLLYAHDESWWGFFQRALPDYEVEVALIAWFGGIQVRPPPDEYLELLLHRTERPLTEEERETLKQITDVMIFDFLVDDHDRIEGHNWLKDSTGHYIFWDSGLAFRHGAWGKRERDRDIFCGRREWVALTRTKDQLCERGCMFSNSTINQLRAYGFENEAHPGNRLSREVRREMRKDPLYPIFDHNAYLPGRARYPKVTYKSTDFLDGIDTRIIELKLYVDECIETYGEENVLL